MIGRRLRPCARIPPATAFRSLSSGLQPAVRSGGQLQLEIDTMKLFVMTSTVVPPNGLPFLEEDLGGETQTYRRLVDLGEAMTLVEVSENAVGDWRLQGAGITSGVRFAALLVEVEEGLFDLDQSRWAVIASIQEWGMDVVRLITPDGDYWEIPSDDLPRIDPPEAFGLTPLPY